jgi:hypothetical protein
MSFEAITRASLSRRRLGLSLLGLASLVLPVTSPRAEQLPMPKDTPILTVSGKIRNFNVADTAVFDRAMLEALGMRSFETHTPWYDEKARFEGPPMTKVLEAVGAYGERVQALALNDYATEIPISDFARFGTILAMKRDNVYLNVREKGPLFVVYPYDSDSELRQQKYYGRSAWQVAQLIIK